MQGITITDDRDTMEQLDIKIDSGDFNNFVPGTYVIKYTVTDRDGNVITFTRNVIVLKVEGPIISEPDIDIDKPNEDNNSNGDNNLGEDNNLDGDNNSNIDISNGNTSNNNGSNDSISNGNTSNNNISNAIVSNSNTSNIIDSNDNASNNNNIVEENSANYSMRDTSKGNRFLAMSKRIVKNPFSWLFLILLLILLLLLLKRRKEEENNVNNK